MKDYNVIANEAIREEMVSNMYQSNDFIIVLEAFNIILQLRIAFVGGDVSFVYDCHLTCPITLHGKLWLHLRYSRIISHTKCR